MDKSDRTTPLTSETAGTTPYADAHRQLLELRALLDRVIVGQDDLVATSITAVFAVGPCPDRGVAGPRQDPSRQGARRGVGAAWARVQCTPDLMPADITGAEIYVTAAGGASTFQFRPGPVFAQLVLVDEINRATPRTQSALLEAMQERQVTHAGVRHRLPEPVFRAGDAEPDRARRHLSAARSAARPLHVQADGPVPEPRVAAPDARRFARQRARRHAPADRHAGRRAADRAAMSHGAARGALQGMRQSTSSSRRSPIAAIRTQIRGATFAMAPARAPCRRWCGRRACVR